MAHKVAITIWRRVRLGSLNRLLNPVLIIAYIEILQKSIPERQPIRIFNGTGISPSTKVKTEIEHHTKYDATAMRNLLILKVCSWLSLGKKPNIHNLFYRPKVTGLFSF
jgi:hypothetical protein